MYIVEIDSKKREAEAIRHLVGSFHKDTLLSAFGFDAMTFVVVEAQKPKLTPGIAGDVDILAGNLAFKDLAEYQAAFAEMESEYPELPHSTKTLLAGKKVSEADGLRWPPEPTHLAGIEVKCAYFTDRLKASKSSENQVAGIRSQVEWLEKMGLDQVGLLDVIGNEPAYKEDGGYFEAMNRASRSLNAMSDVLADRLPRDSKAAQFVWAIGSVGGGDEGTRGAGTLRRLRPPAKNPLLEANDSDALEYRAVLQQNIPKLLAHLPAPRYFPVVLIDCLHCKAVHFLDDPSCRLA